MVLKANPSPTTIPPTTTGTTIPPTTTGTTIPNAADFFGTPGANGQSPAAGPNNTTPLITTYDAAGTGMTETEQFQQVKAADGSVKTFSQEMQELAHLTPAQLLTLQQSLYSAGLLPTVPTGNLNDNNATAKAYLGLLRETYNAGTDIQTQMANDIVATNNAGGPTAKAATTTKTIGLGKYPIKLVSPTDVAAVANATAQQLTGMDATQAQIDAITKTLQGQQLAQGQTEFQQYVGQQEAQYEYFGGGVAKPGGAAGPPPAAAPGSAAAQINPSSVLGQVGVAAGVINPAGALPAGYTKMPDGTITVDPAAAAANKNPLPAGAITLANGTILIPPTQQIYQAAPDVSSVTAQAIRGTPQYSAYNFLQAANAIEQLVKGGGR